MSRGGQPEKVVVLGRIAGIYGVRGWVRVHSYTEPRERIVEYRPWLLLAAGTQHQVEVREGRRHGKTVIARLAGCDDPAAAAPLVGADVAVLRGRLPQPVGGDVYWTDLEGLRVQTRDGVALGRVDHLLETGANDVLVVRDGRRERLIPWIRETVVTRVDVEAGELTVDWDPEF